MDKIGEKIKKARKELNLSQAALAGDQMTKGMLSQIENNQAMPSMRNLHYIAERLGKPVSYFLQEEKEPFPLNQVIHEFALAIKKSRGNKAKMLAEQNIEELQQILKKYDIAKNSKVYADIQLQYGYSLGILKCYDESEERILEAIDIYVKLHLYLEAAKASLKLGKKYMDFFEYEQCLDITNKANELYASSLQIDNEFESEILYMKAFIYSAMGDLQKAIDILVTSIQNMKKLNCFYRPDEVYRLTAVFNLYDGKNEEFLFNIDRAIRYAELSDNDENLSRIYLTMSVYDNDINEPYKALEHLEHYERNFEDKRFIYYLQKARAYYLLENFEKAYEFVNKLNFKDDVNHVLDYNLLWSGKIYEGLILNKLGRGQEGIVQIKVAIEKLEVFSPSRVLANAYKSLSELYSNIGDYENAYRELKKADDVIKKLS